MKKIMYTGLFISAVMLLLPLSAINNTQKTIAATTVNDTTPAVVETQSTSFKIFNAQSDEINEITSQDYIFGVVAAEMPALYEKEALKAQAVAAYTFALCRKAENSEKDYDITTDSAIDQGFVSKTELAERWGENAQEYTKKIEEAVKEAEGYVITHNNKPITAVYHAISSGKTESAKDVWDVELEYLSAVACEADKLATNYKTEAVFTVDEIKEKLKDTVEFTGEPSNFFGSIARTDSGAVKAITVCSKELTGSQIRELLELRSSNFNVIFAEDKFTFTVYGYGHGVGMSQNGANSMAKLGSSFEEILKHFYKGCEVEKIKSNS